jgi:glycine/D-amino acid oxidase-like deaminating enzyme
VPSILRGDYAPSVSFVAATFRSQLQGSGRAQPSSSSSLGSLDALSSLTGYGARYLRAALWNRGSINATFAQLADLSLALTTDIVRQVNPGNELSLVPYQLWLFTSAEAAKAKHVAGYSPGARILSPEECAQCLPQVAKQFYGKQGGGCAEIREDFSADARRFTELVAARLEQVTFRFNTRVRGLARANGDTKRVTGVVLDDGRELLADHVGALFAPRKRAHAPLAAVVAMGPWTAAFVRENCGVALPIMPVRGCSVDLVGCKNAPRVGFSDLSGRVPHFQVTPFGDTVRLVGFADPAPPPVLGGKDNSSPAAVDCPAHYRPELLARARALMPDLEFSHVRPAWCGLRPVTPDLLPIVGSVGPRDGNVWVNCGHGAAGWTLCAATGKVLAVAMGLAPPASPLEQGLVARLGLGLGR